MCATLQERGESVLMRSYDMPKDAKPVSEAGEALHSVGGIENITIKIAARATSAAPTYFPAVELKGDDGKPVVFWDGGLLNNNPIDQLWRARLDLVGDDKPAPKVACVLSLGTSWSTKGSPTVFDKWPILLKVKGMTSWPLVGNGISKLIDWITPAEESIAFLTNTEAKHLDFHRYINRISHRNADPDAQTKYFRFNTPTQNTYIDMADYKQMLWLANCTKQWMKDPNVAPKVEKVARLLAKKAN
jgi:patatin-like phospholipase